MPDLEPTFLGFLAKKVVLRPEWLKCPSVEAVCSVSECISAGPEDRLLRWTHNAAGLYDSEALALEVVAPDERSGFTLFAYRVHPLRFDEEQPTEAWDPRSPSADLPPTPDLSAYELIGLDLVGRSSSDFFECSPLSCNGMAGEVAVNRWCLVDELERAIEVGRWFGRKDCHVEPAAYHLVEVWRRR